MTPDESFAAALAQARALGPPPPGRAPVDAFRTEAVEWLARVPEPPLYPRTDDPARTAADIIANARVNLAVTQGTASFFFDPSNPLSQLQAIVSGIKSLGYTFVSPPSLPG